jgi:hypothetical protein
MHRTRLGLAFAFMLLSGLGARAADVIQLADFEQTGKVVGGAPGVLVFDVLGNKYQAQLDTKDFQMPTVVELNAKAYPSFLQQGMYVRFQAKVDAKKRRIVEPLKQLAIFSPTGETRLGAFAEELNAPPPLAAEGAIAIGEQPKPEGEAPKAARGSGTGMFIVGQVSRFRKGSLTVKFPGGQLEGEVADDAVIDVNVTDKALALSMLRPGDSVHVKGGTTEAGKLYASKIAATLARPLGEAPPIKRRPLTPEGGDKVAAPEGEAIKPSDDFGVAAADAAEEAARAANPGRARILKVN